MVPVWGVGENEFGCNAPEGEAWVGEKLSVASVHVREVVSFYTMFTTQPLGKQKIQVCTSLPCLLKGANQLVADLEKRFGIRVGETTPDGKVTLSKVECLCACEQAPMAQVNDDYVGPLKGNLFEELCQHAGDKPDERFDANIVGSEANSVGFEANEPEIDVDCSAPIR